MHIRGIKEMHEILVGDFMKKREKLGRQDHR